MKKFEIKGPDGRVYTVEGDTPEAAIDAFEKTFGKPTSWARSRQNQQLMEVLENRLKSGGSLSVEEQKVYDSLIRGKAMDEAVVGEYEAGWRGIQKGASFNLADEIGGAVKSAFGDNTYEHERDLIREKDRVAAARYPDAFAMGETAGAVGTTVPLAVMSGGGAIAPAASRAAAKVSPALSRAILALSKQKPIGTAMAQGVGVGAATEGARGFADGQGVANRLTKATPGAIIGGATGGLAPAAGRGANHLWKYLANRPKPLPGMSRKSTEVLLPAFKDSDVGHRGGVRGFLQRHGPEAVPADVPDGLQNQAQGLAAIGGPGGSQLSRALRHRAEGAADRINTTIERHLGPADEAFNRKRALAAQRTKTLGPEYEAALRANAEIDTGSIRESIAWSQHNAGPNTAPHLAKLGRAFADADTVSAPKLHAIRSDLSDDIEEAYRAGRHKKAAVLKQHLQQIDEILYDAAPGYKDAQTGYANNKAMEDQIERGRNDLFGGPQTAVDPKDFEVEFHGLTEAQQDARRAGIRASVKHVMGTARNDPLAAKNPISKGYTDQKLQTAFGKLPADDIRRRIEAENVFTHTLGQVSGGSQTAARSAARDALTVADPKAQSGLSIITGGMSDAVRDRVINPVFVEPGKRRVNAELGRFYSMQSPSRDELVKEIVERLAQKPKAENRSALAQLFMDQLVRGAGAAGNTALLRPDRK